MLREIIILVGLSISTTAAAQSFREPTDTELHAAYCAALVNTRVHQLQKAIEAVPTFSPPLKPEIVEGMRDDLQASSDEGQRMAAYVAPKLAYVDPTEIVVAEDRGKTDAVSWWSDTLTPSVTPPPELGRRVAACEKADWLPF